MHKMLFIKLELVSILQVHHYFLVLLLSQALLEEERLLE